MAGFRFDTDTPYKNSIYVYTLLRCTPSTSILFRSLQSLLHAYAYGGMFISLEFGVWSTSMYA